MVYNALRGYLQLANGLTEVTKQRATEAARALSAQFGIQGEDAIAGAGVAAGIASQQVQALAEDLLASARSNRKLLTELVRVEVERGASRLGLAEQHQIESLRATVGRLEEQVSSLLGGGRRSAAAKPAATRPAGKSTAGGARPLRAPTAKKAAAKKVPAKKVAAKKVAVKQVPAKKVPAKKVAAKKVAVKKAPTRKVPAKKVPTRPVAVVAAAPGADS